MRRGKGKQFNRKLKIVMQLGEKNVNEILNLRMKSKLHIFTKFLKILNFSTAVFITEMGNKFFSDRKSQI